MKKLLIPVSSILLFAYFLPLSAGLSSCKKETTKTVRDTIIQKDTVIRKDTIYQDPANNPNIRLSNGLLAYYPFSGNTNDASGNGNNGTLFNGAVIASDKRGNPSSALSVNGFNGVLVNDGGRLNPTDSMSISLDVMMRAIAGRQVFISKVNYSTGSGAIFGLGPSFPGDKRILFSPVKAGIPCDRAHTDAEVVGRVYGIEPAPESWYTIVVTVKAGLMKMYINGILVSQVTGSVDKMNYCPNSQLVIGAWWSGDPAGLNGKIDNVRIYNRLLNQDEISFLSR
ncbi:LamG domain-containing protein [Paraflavisolibacter sp. H34]|uniref:LamG domain-containing protein n=1 Tax=Huijunlia imazamoxiresistens TaxID=3127457 RepID=UPI003017FE15